MLTKLGADVDNMAKDADGHSSTKGDKRSRGTESRPAAPSKDVAKGRSINKEGSQGYGPNAKPSMPTITEIPIISDPDVETITIYPVLEPYSYVRITYDDTVSNYYLDVIEPQLSAEDEKLLRKVKDTMERTLGYEWRGRADFDKTEYLKGCVESYIRSRGQKITPAQQKKIEYYILRDFAGYGPIDYIDP